MSDDLARLALDAARPLPTPDDLSRPFWEAARRHELRLQRCRVCATVRYYPRPRCPTCLSGEAEWECMSGAGTVYSYSVVHRPLSRWFADHVPLVVAIVELDEGVRLMTNVVGCDPDDVRIGLRVTVAWEDVNDDISLPLFTPVTGNDAARG